MAQIDVDVLDLLQDLMAVKGQKKQDATKAMGYASEILVHIQYDEKLDVEKNCSEAKEWFQWRRSSNWDERLVGQDVPRKVS